jgi:hypothetical protein
MVGHFCPMRPQEFQHRNIPRLTHEIMKKASIENILTGNETDAECAKKLNKFFKKEVGLRLPNTLQTSKYFNKFGITDNYAWHCCCTKKSRDVEFIENEWLYKYGDKFNKTMANLKGMVSRVAKEMLKILNLDRFVSPSASASADRADAASKNSQLEAQANALRRDLEIARERVSNWHNYTTYVLDDLIQARARVSELEHALHNIEVRCQRTREKYHY